MIHYTMVSKRRFSDFQDKSKIECWSEKNILKPHEVSIRSGKKYWFKCDKCGHDFETALSHITGVNYTWCPFCSGRRVCDDTRKCVKCLPRSFYGFEDKSKIECWSKKNILKPWQVSIATNKGFWFKCNNCEHDFEISLSSVTGSKKQWCPFCSGRRICDNSKDCVQCLPRSFYSFHDKSKINSWSEKNLLKPWQVSISTHKKFWFKCGKCEHEFEKILSDVTGKNLGWCQFCTGKKLCGNSKDCSLCSPNTFYSTGSIRIQFWSERNTLKTWEIFRSSDTKYWFKCDKCPHEFESSISNIIGGKWCPYCSSNKLCEDPRKCETCLKKTFQSFDSDKVACWSGNNKLKPYMVFRSSGTKFLFVCESCSKEFKSTLDDIIRGNWCPRCRDNKAMKILNKYMDKYNIENEVEEPVKCGGRNLFFDMTCKYNGRIFHIESDGAQHFSLKGMIGVSRGKIEGSEERFKDQRTRDLLKEDHVVKNGLLLFRFSYRQTKEIESLVKKMKKICDSGTCGVVYMDPDIYWGTSA